MKNLELNFKKVLFVLLSFGLMNLIASCEKEGLTEDNFDTLDARVEKEKAPKSNEGFKAFHEGFEGKYKAWVDQTDPGILGWCGNINLHTKKDGNIDPSKGNGYATVAWGDCNYFWSSDPDDNPNKDANLPIFEFGAPATQDPSLWSASWPTNGFSQQLDIYLDPEMFNDETPAFVYTNSLFNSDVGEFKYFTISVLKEGNTLNVAGQTVEDVGWYTFRYNFNSNMEGGLMIDFVLLKEGEEVYQTSIDWNMPLPGEEPYPTSSFHAEEYGSGYIWFVALQEGVQLPIDEHYLSPANSSNAH